MSCTPTQCQGALQEVVYILNLLAEVREVQGGCEETPERY